MIPAGIWGGLLSNVLNPSPVKPLETIEPETEKTDYILPVMGVVAVGLIAFLLFMATKK
jgi:hypothetical protein